MARVIVALAVFLGIILAISWCDAGTQPVRDPKTDCEQHLYTEKIKRLCGSTSTKQHSKLIRQSEPGEKIDERHRVHHHKKYQNDLEPVVKNHSAPINISTIVSDNKNNNSYFEESLFIWYLNPVQMGSDDGDDSLSSRDRGTYGEIFSERRRRQQNLKKKLAMEFFENTCCQKGCFFPDDFSELMGKIC